MTSPQTAVKTWEPLAPTANPSPLPAEFKPRLNGAVQFTSNGDAISEIDLVYQIAYIDTDDGVRLARLLPFIDGTLPLRGLAARSGLPVETVAEIVQTLYELGAVSSADPQSIDALSFYRHTAQIGQMEASKLHQTGLLRALSSGPSRRLLIGYLVEGYHFVEAAASHVAPAIVSASSRRLRMMASEYLSNEYTHGAHMRAGLELAGVPASDLERARPLPSTLAIINSLRWTARTDPLEYWACLSLSETEGEEVAERARARWADIAAYNLVPAEVFQSYVDHDVLDSDEGHGALCAEPFAEAPPLTPGQQERIQDTVIAYASTWLLNADEILSFYGDPDGPLCYIPSLSR